MMLLRAKDCELLFCGRLTPMHTCFHINVTAARNLDGVSLVATQADLDADNIGDIECQFRPPLIGGGEMQLVSKSAMVRDTNRYAGDIIAMVIAENQEIVEFAIELIEVEYQPMPAVTDVYAAMRDNAPQLYDCYPNNIAFEWGTGDLVGVDEAMKDAITEGHKIVEIDVVNNRIVINSMETRPIVAAPGERHGSLDIWCGTQGVVGVAQQIANSLSMDPGLMFMSRLAMLVAALV